ncbi:MAG: hypothetical protein MJZ31_10545 [Bacteroidales bacterium]|nr:hypothetical protein [Bacteroidales bacterium]
MKTFNVIKFAALAACAFTTVAASAKSDAKAEAKVFINNYRFENIAVVSVDAKKTDNVITNMEITSEDGNLVFVSKRVAKLKAAQYLLDIANLEDGAYTVNFKLRKGQDVSKTFVVVDGKVVR